MPSLLGRWRESWPQSTHGSRGSHTDLFVRTDSGSTVGWLSLPSGGQLSACAGHTHCQHIESILAFTQSLPLPLIFPQILWYLHNFASLSDSAGPDTAQELIAILVSLISGLASHAFSQIVGLTEPEITTSKQWMADPCQRNSGMLVPCHGHGATMVHAHHAGCMTCMCEPTRFMPPNLAYIMKSCTDTKGVVCVRAGQSAQRGPRPHQVGAALTTRRDSPLCFLYPVSAYKSWLMAQLWPQSRTDLHSNSVLIAKHWALPMAVVGDKRSVVVPVLA